MPQDKRGNWTFPFRVKWLLCLFHLRFPPFDSTDSKEPLVPPRFLERFSNRKVKQGTSITLSVKVEGRCVRVRGDDAGVGPV